MSAFKMTHGGILPGSGNSNHTLIIIMEQYFRSFARERLPEADGGYPQSCGEWNPPRLFLLQVLNG